MYKYYIAGAIILTLLIAVGLMASKGMMYTAGELPKCCTSCMSLDKKLHPKPYKVDGTWYGCDGTECSPSCYDWDAKSGMYSLSPCDTISCPHKGPFQPKSGHNKHSYHEKF